MTVKDMANTYGFQTASLPDGDREVTGVYMGDLLSWVMGRADAGDAWLTIMSNQNIVAVATLADTACIILTEGVKPDEGVAALAEQKGVNILLSAKSSYETALLLCDVV